MSDRTKVTILGGPPEFRIWSGIRPSHRTWFLPLLGLVLIIGLAMGWQHLRKRPSSLQLFHNGKPIVGASVDWPSALETVTSNEEGMMLFPPSSKERRIWIRSPEFNGILDLSPGQHRRIRRYDVPQVSTTVTEYKSTSRWFGVFEATSTDMQIGWKSNAEMNKAVASGKSEETLAREAKAKIIGHQRGNAD